MKKLGEYAAVFKRELLICFMSLLCGLIITGFITKAYSDKTSEKLANKFIRLHVLANSNSEIDQKLKLKVRDSVMNMLSDKVTEITSIDAARKEITKSLYEIEQTADNVLRDEGFSYTAKASIRKTSFPTKYYGNFALVAGTYEALTIEIGKAKGNNWWCVVYPPLCFVDVATGEKTVSDETADKMLKSGLTDEEYKLVAKSDSPSVIIKFKMVELWQERKMAKAAKRNYAKK